MMKPLQQVAAGLLVVLSILVFDGCGSGSGGGGGGIGGLAGGIGGTGVTSGTLSGFGSVFVNGIEFETDGASRTVNDVTDISNGSDDDRVLGIGMVVTIIGTVNDDGLTGTADSIEYDNEIDGPVAAAPVEDPDGNSKTLDIFNVTVVVDRNTTVFVTTDYDSLVQNDVLEVSGYFDANGKLLATRVEKKGVLDLGVSEVEIKGEVSGFNGIDTFMLGGITVTFDGATEFEDLPGTVRDGQFVEVKGTLVTTISMSANRIELEEDGFGDDVDRISIEGIVTDFDGISNFKVAGQRVDASDATFEPAALAATIADGDRVETGGSIINGILEAEEVEQRGGDVRVSAVVDSTNNVAGTVTLQVVPGQTITVTSSSQTQIEDKLNEEEPFGISGIAAGDFLNVEGFVDGNGNFIATQIEREEPDDIVLRGPADVPPTGGGTVAGTLSILGVEIATDDATDFEDASEEDIDGTNFFLQVKDGDLVEYTDYNEDGQPADGIADEVEFED